MDYTVEVYKKDGRTKIGHRLILKQDFTDINHVILENSCAARFPESKGYRYIIFNTYVEKKDFMTGKKFMERYDRPYFASPSSETYWSN
jgi:hypothetical protein